MTLFKIYKSICKLIGDDVQYKSSEIKLINFNDRIIVSLKKYSDEELEEELDYVSRVYFKLLNHIDNSIIRERLNSMGLYRCHNKPNSDVDMNTILSVIYINKYMKNYDGEQMFLDSLKVLFKNKDKENSL